MRSKLKASKKAHYKDMYVKLRNGTYNGDIIFSEMQAAAALRTKDILKQERFSDPAQGRKYINSMRTWTLTMRLISERQDIMALSCP